MQLQELRDLGRRSMALSPLWRGLGKEAKLKGTPSQTPPPPDFSQVGMTWRVQLIETKGLARVWQRKRDLEAPEPIASGFPCFGSFVSRYPQARYLRAVSFRPSRQDCGPARRQDRVEVTARLGGFGEISPKAWPWDSPKITAGWVNESGAEARSTI